MIDKDTPDRIYAARGNDGNTYWVRERHDTFDKTDSIPQTEYIKASKVNALVSALEFIMQGTCPHDGILPALPLRLKAREALNQYKGTK